MAAPKLSLLLLLAVSLLLAGVRPETAAAERRTGDSESQLRHKLQQLASKISALESWIVDRTSKLKSKDEKLILEKSASEDEFELLQTEKENDVERMIGKAGSRTGEIEKQVDDISKEFETQSRMIEALEDRDNDMEKQMQELNLKVENASEKSAQVQKWAEPHLKTVKIKWILVAKEQWIMLTTHTGPYVEALTTKTIETYEICKSTITPHIIRVQEVTDPYLQEAKKFTKPRIEKIASSVKPHVEKVGITLKPYTERIYAYGQLLKSTTVYHRQVFIATHWNENGKLALDLFLQKASEKSAQVQKWAEPHLEIVKIKWIPVAKEQCIILTTHAGPYVEALSTKTIETFEICKSTITPHIFRVQELTDPYFQEAKKFTKPRIEKIATSVKPHVEKVGITLKPYTERIYASGQFLKSATVYHRQVFIATRWNENGKLALDLFLQKASEKSAQVQKWAEPHLEIVKIKWIPVAKEQCIILTTHAGPYVEALSTKTIETYEICKSTITPHIIRVQELTDPYFQEAKKFTKPLIEKIATSVKPHVEKVGITLKPYTERIYASGQFLKFATVYHRQFEKKNEEQDHVIQKIEDSLQEVLLGAHLVATSKSKELTEVHGAWLPPWLANLICRCQDFTATHWNENGKPALDLFLQKASEKSAQVQKWAEPHLETVKIVDGLMIFWAQAAIHEKLEKHEFSNSLANNELVWFMASALLALPIYFLYRIISAIFCKKCRQPTRNAHVNEMPRWLRYADK